MSEVDNLNRRVTEIEIQIKKIIENEQKIIKDIQNFISSTLVK
ncbi:hypothetical protein [Nitrososphaeria virus YSH_1032793]|uniref:Uncharacterized protein n=1 Tax=Nitrososphaeria virus YSH_1032793 TaxID=3071320 RepID=A0A976UAA8_9CAUD|nr:hypothetical protein QKV91_gp15 [Yangshan Harbor Nitrososphaeria virus]UVF62219.1 hypothetical protein [Nitrososphaeria virus YSH_1032793]